MVVIQVHAQCFLGRRELEHIVQRGHHRPHDEDWNDPGESCPSNSIALSTAVGNFPALPKLGHGEFTVFDALDPIALLSEEPPLLAKLLHRNAHSGGNSEEQDQRHSDETENQLLGSDDVLTLEGVQSETVDQRDRKRDPGIIRVR